MVMECPAHARFPAFGLRLPYVVEECGPAEPECRVYTTNDIFQHLERMVEVVLVSPAVALLHDVECRQFRQDEL